MICINPRPIIDDSWKNTHTHTWTISSFLSIEIDSNGRSNSTSICSSIVVVAVASADQVDIAEVTALVFVVALLYNVQYSTGSK